MLIEMSYSSALGINHNNRQTQSVYTNYTQIMMHFHVFTKRTRCCCQISISNYTTIQKLGVGNIFKMFLKRVFYTRQVHIYLMKNIVKTVILWNNMTI